VAYHTKAKITKYGSCQEPVSFVVAFLCVTFYDCSLLDLYLQYINIESVRNANLQIWSVSEGKVKQTSAIGTREGSIPQVEQ
jgi:hypothetical protein